MTARAYLVLVIAGCALAAAVAVPSAKIQQQIRTAVHDRLIEKLTEVEQKLERLHELRERARGGGQTVQEPEATEKTSVDEKPTDLEPSSPVPQSGCVARKYNYSSTVCVCNARYCDDAPSEPAGGVQMGHFLRVVSTEDGRRMEASMGNMVYSDQPQTPSDAGYNKTADVIFDFRPFVVRQRMQGFGGAMTDSAASDMQKLSPASRGRLLDAYFGQNGSRYQFVRVPMGGSDFSTREYSYDDNNGVADPTLANFSLAQEDLNSKIPVLLEAQKAAGQPLKLFTAPWGAPGWMVNTDENQLKNLKEEYWQTWAEYFAKFMDAYKSWGLPFWGLAPQNEPANGYLFNYYWNRLGWSPESMREWLGNNLIPTLKKKQSDVKIMIHDDQRTRLPEWPARTLNDSAVRDAVDGIAVHWYEDGLSKPEVLTETHNLFPEKFLLYTEACDGASISGGEPVQLGNWARGFNYARDIIQVVNNWVTGWVDWNLALDLAGGPSWAKNNLDAAIIVNATADEFYKQPTYYAIQHFSRYVPPGSVNVYIQAIPVTTAGGDVPNVLAVAFVTPEGRFVIVFINEDPVPRTVSVRILGVAYYIDELLPYSIQTSVAHPRPTAD